MDLNQQGPEDSLKFFRLLPIGNLIDIRTARFLEDFNYCDIIGLNICRIRWKKNTK